MTNEDRDRYNFYYFLQDEPNSDYCFSVIQSWLAYECPVEVSQVDEGLIVIKYCDVLFENKSTTLYALIGKHQMLTPTEAKKILALTNEDTKLVLSGAQLSKLGNHIDSNFEVTSDLGLNDYIYSVSEYSDLQKPDYRRVRREINIFNREHPDAKIKLTEVDLSDKKNWHRVINIHHCWEDTYKYQNDPERVEGEIIAKIMSDPLNLGVRCVLGTINDEPEGLFIFTNLPMKSGHYINLHHARFSYKYKFMNDIFWVDLAKYLSTEGVEFINFERDANIEGLRHHKQLLKPKHMSSMHLVSK